MTALSGNVRPHDSAVNEMMVDGVGTTGVWAQGVTTQVRFRARAPAWGAAAGMRFRAFAATRGARAIDSTRAFLTGAARRSRRKIWAVGPPRDATVSPARP
jgi:hypothetical protein